MIHSFLVLFPPVPCFFSSTQGSSQFFYLIEITLSVVVTRENRGNLTFAVVQRMAANDYFHVSLTC